MAKTCPACGATLQRLIGNDGHEVVAVVDGSRRALKLNAVYACPSCEHVEGSEGK